MRIDKFLKNSRLIKRRTVAKEACDQGRISINGKVAKAGSEVGVNDELEITFGNRKLTVRINALDMHVTKEKSKELYDVIKEETLG